MSNVAFDCDAYALALIICNKSQKTKYIAQGICLEEGNYQCRTPSYLQKQLTCIQRSKDVHKDKDKKARRGCIDSWMIRGTNKNISDKYSCGSTLVITQTRVALSGSPLCTHPQSCHDHLLPVAPSVLFLLWFVLKFATLSIHPQKLSHLTSNITVPNFPCSTYRPCGSLSKTLTDANSLWSSHLK